MKYQTSSINILVQFSWHTSDQDKYVLEES